jgi:hypothetical protein
MELSNGDKRWIQAALKAHRLKPEGLKIALVPNDDGSIDLFAIEYRQVLATYELEAGETIEEFAKCIQDFLEGSEVRAPSVSNDRAELTGE